MADKKVPELEEKKADPNLQMFFLRLLDLKEDMKEMCELIKGEQGDCVLINFFYKKLDKIMKEKE